MIEHIGEFRATARVMYSETEEEMPYTSEGYVIFDERQRVSVELRAYDSEDARDLILHTLVIVDGKTEVNTSKVLAGDLTDTVAIRQAVAAFDAALAAHPNAARERIT